MSDVRAGTATRHGAVLFTDLVGFTEFTDAQGDAAAVEVLDEQTRLLGMRSPAACRPGREGTRRWTDALVRSRDAGPPGRRRHPASDRDGATERGFPLSLRMGMHCGEVVERGADFVGQTVNIASRIADLAGPGEFLVSEQVVDGSRRWAVRAAFLPVGPTRVKGVTTPIWLYRLAMLRRTPHAASSRPDCG